MRLYSVTDDEGDDCVVVVANNSKEAKKIGLAELDCEYIDARVRWIKKANVQNGKAGIYTDRHNALKNGWYIWITDLAKQFKRRQWHKRLLIACNKKPLRRVSGGARR